MKDELKNIAPNLAKLKKQRSDTKPELPANFFHNMQVGVLSELRTDFDKIENFEKPKSSKNPFAFLLKPRFQIAFGLGLSLLIAGVFWFKNPAPETPKFADLTDEEILTYIDENIEDYDALSLSEYSDENTDFEENITSEEIDLYLEDNIDEIEDSDFENLF